MCDQTDIKHIITAARGGDRSAEKEFFSILCVRFLPVIKLELQKYPVVVKDIDLEERTEEICSQSFEEIRKKYLISNSEWNLAHTLSYLHNCIDDFVANSLTELAKKGNINAESSLFLIIRKKLMEWVDKKRWRSTEIEHSDE